MKLHIQGVFRIPVNLFIYLVADVSQQTISSVKTHVKCTSHV